MGRIRHFINLNLNFDHAKCAQSERARIVPEATMTRDS